MEGYYEKEDSIIDRVFRSIGIKSYRVGAVTDTGKTKSGKIKRTLIGTWSKSKPDIVKCSLLYSWIKEPNYTQTDEMSMYVENGTPIYKTVKTKYSCFCYYPTTKKTKNCMSTPSTIYNNNGVGIKQKLRNSTRSGIVSEHVLTISYDAKIDNKKSWKYVQVNGEYYHQQSKLSVEPSLSLSSNGSLNLTPSIKKKFQYLTNPPQVFVYFK